VSVSAWDVAGAVGGFLLFALGALSVLTAHDRSAENQTFNAIWACLGLTWATFCIARLFGAHA